MATSTYNVSLDPVAGNQLPAPVVARTTNRFYAPELDVLRFGAFLLVFSRHVAVSLGGARNAVATQAAPIKTAGTASHEVAAASGFLQEGIRSLDFGVCLFFFLSSFLITRLLLLEKQSTGTVAVGRFYMRRLLRIWPLYFVFLTAVPLLAHWLPLLQVQPARLIAATLFVANWSAVFHGWQSISIQPLWSVSVEEQFYAVWPWVARPGRAAIIGLSAVLMLVAVGTLWFLGGRPGLQVTATWPNTLVQGLFLAGGALAACLSSPERNRFRDSTRSLMIVSGLGLWLLASAGLHVLRPMSPGAASLIAGYLLVLAGTGLIFYAVAGWNRRELPRSLILLGRMSYGLYVFHAAVLLALYSITPHLLRAGHITAGPFSTVIAVSLFGLLLTIGLASLSYHYLEMPFLKLKGRFAVIASRPV